jgi:Fe2+ transport system protein FeoA
MGAVAGTKVEVVRVQPFGGPLSIKILGSVFSLRQHEANQIAVELA